MSTLPGPFYQFRTAAQWDRVAIAGLAETLRIDPEAAGDGAAIAGCAIRAVALSASGEIFLLDAGGTLFAAGREAPYPGVPGPAIGAAARLIAGTERLWALCGGGGEGARLIQLDRASLHFLVDVAADGIEDIAPDGRDGLWLLAANEVRRIDDRGAEVGAPLALDWATSAIAAAGGRIALLSEGGHRLFLIDPGAGPATILDLTQFSGPGWAGGDARLSSAGAAFLVEGALASGERRFLLIGPGGELLANGSWRDDRAPALLAASGSDLVGLFDSDGAQWLVRFGGLARTGGERRLTPTLETESPAGSWLRAEVTARLPERATLSLRWAASADENLRRDVEQALADPARPMARRLEKVDELLDGRWSDEATYIGAHRDGETPFEGFAFPLYRAEGPLLWVDVRIRRNSADAPPEIEAMRVLHEAGSLMDDLPAIYRGDGDGDGTMRGLVAVLEATTQGIDDRIGTLAQRLDPERTDTHWLPDLAAMLGLPFHDALAPDMQRRLIGAAATILARRGTRLGLVALFEALFPGRPVRVIDRTEQLVPIALGGGGAAGRRLPALLAGPSVRVPKLNARLVLGATGLCRTNACADALIAPPPQVLVAIPATAGERRRYGDAVAAMAEAMIPAGVRLRLNWTPWRAGAGPVSGDVLARFDTPEALSLGSGPALGRARTGGRAAARLDGHGVTPARHRLL